MLFQWFWRPFSHFGPKSMHLALVFIRYFGCVCRLLKKLFFYWFYKVSRLGVNATRKPSLGNAFSMILEAFSTFWTDFLPFGIGFYKVFRIRFRTPQKVVFHWFYKVFSLCRIATRKPSLANAFSMFLVPFCTFGHNFFILTLVFIRFSDCNFRPLGKLIFYWFYKVFWLCKNATRKPSLANAFPMFFGSLFPLLAKKELKLALFYKLLWCVRPRHEKVDFLLVL